MREVEHNNAHRARGGVTVRPHPNAQGREYVRGMAKPRPRTRTTVARNLRALMKREPGMSQRDLAEKAGVSQRAISSILSENVSCSVETLEAIARPFGLTAWELLIPSMADDLGLPASLAAIVESYVEADQAGREFLLRAADRERRKAS